jgi:hypothetical protein
MMRALDDPYLRTGWPWCNAINGPLGRYHNKRDKLYRSSAALFLLGNNIRQYYKNHVLELLTKTRKSMAPTEEAYLLMAHQALTIGSLNTAMETYVATLPLVDDKKRQRYRLPDSFA